DQRVAGVERQAARRLTAMAIHRFQHQAAPQDVRRALTEPLAVRVLLTSIVLAFLALFLLLPLVTVFSAAFSKGIAAYLEAIREPDAVAALKLTLLTAAIAVPCNLVFGLCAGWAIAKFDFPGKSVLTTLIDLPFAISRVISGMVFVLIFGRNGIFG